MRSTTMEDGGELWVVANKSEELRLQAQIAEQGHVLASSNEAYMVVDSYGSVRYANAFCEQERGYETGAMVGQQLHGFEQQRLLDGQAIITDAEASRARIKGYLDEGGAHRYDAWHLRKDKSRFPVEVVARPYRMTNETVLLLTVRDESERLQFVQDLMTARAEAEASNRAKSAFLAITSHELRTPLTAILAFTDFLLLDYGSDERADLVDNLRNIKRSGKSLQQLINDILDFAKIEGQTLSLDFKSVSLKKIVSALYDRWHIRYEKKGLQLVVPSNLEELSVTTDPLRLNQLLDNLVGNALKFSQDGAVEVSVLTEGDTVEFLVQDTGPGIDIAHREKIFEPFYQVQDATTRNAEGTGLGLYICQQLSKLLGGSIRLDWTEVDEGCRFAIRVPRKGSPPSRLEMSDDPAQGALKG